MTKFYWFLADEQFQPEEIVEHAALAEKLGFDGVMISEHLQPWVDDKGTSGFAFATLGAIAAKTSKIKMITGVTTPLFRFHPAIVAQASATIDRLSNGRFELGIGTGENLNEAPLGLVFPGYKERSERIIESMKIMRSLLDGNKLSFKGKYYTVDNLKLYTPPFSRVPIYMAAGGPQSASTATTYSDGIITSVKNPQETLDNIVTPNRDKLKTLIASRWSVYAKDDKDAWEALLAQRGLRAPSRSTSFDPLELQKEADTLDHNEILSKYSLVKSPEEYLKVYSPLVIELNADIVVIQTTSINQLETLKMFGTDVLPKLRTL